MQVGDELFWGYDDYLHLESFLAGKDSPGRGGACSLPSRAIQSTSGYVRAPSHARGLRRIALDRRTIPSLDCCLENDGAALPVFQKTRAQSVTRLRVMGQFENPPS